MNIAVKDMLDGVDPQKVIQAATYLIETKNPLYFIDSLFYRSESYHQIGEYKLAVNDLLKLREILIAQEKQSKDLQKKQELKGNIA
ncbi:MAG: hypothetical protein LBL38_01125, partial [Lactobacillales bacterium]|nr:hypothetical protein [Lactobacillales bacterium]